MFFLVVVVVGLVFVFIVVVGVFMIVFVVVGGGVVFGFGVVLRFGVLVFFLVVVRGLGFGVVTLVMVGVLFVRVGFWFLGGVVFGGVFGFGFFLGFALFFAVGTVLAGFLEFFGGAEIGEAFFEEFADGAAVFVEARAVRGFETSFGDAFEGIGGMERGGVWGGRLGGLVAEGIELIAEGHELLLEGLELLVDLGIGPGGGGPAVGVRDGGERL